MSGQPLPYSQRPEWADVVPVKVKEGGKVVAIQYTPDHAEALSYFRAVLRSGELSERVLALTGDMIRYNQADYTAWRTRWRCVQALGSSLLPGELDYTHGVMLENAKNYQLWNHRRLCATALGPSCGPREHDLTREAIMQDEKNYHAWAHRQAVVKLTGQWEQELEFAAEMIGRDVRNNTAWNQRMFVLQHTPRPQGEQEAAAWMRAELEFVAAAIQKAPRNEAPWRYLTGLFAVLQPWASTPRALSRCPEVYTICCEALRDCPSCAPALDVLAQYYEGVAALAAARARQQQQQQQQAGGDGSQGQSQDVGDAVAAQVGTALQACDTATALLDEALMADPMRVPYWSHRQQCFGEITAAAQGLLT